MVKWVDYRSRGVFDVHCDRANLSFQVLTYGLPDPGDVAIKQRLAKRGFDKVTGELDGKICQEGYNFGKEGRKPGEPEQWERTRASNTQLWRGSIQTGGDAGAVESHDRHGGPQGVQSGEAEAG